MTVKIEKELYAEAGTKGITLSEHLEKVRPSEVNGLDAFEFALAEREIDLTRDTVEKFYRTADDRVLFPEFINRNIRIGMVGLGPKDVTLEDIVATTLTIDAGVYETIKAEFDNKKLDFKKIAEGAAFPTVRMSVGKQSITLAKIGIALEATYEVLRRMKLPLLSIHMQLIGKRLAKKMTAYAVYTLLNGDGNSNAADKTTAALSYANLLTFDLDMDDWEATVWFAKKAMIESLCLIDEFKDTRLFDTARTGAWVTPFGNQMKKFNWSDTTLGNDQIFQIDKSAALEMVKESGAELIETDKVIDRQFEKTVASQVMGFSKIFTEACRVFEKAS
ncbi:MAG: hypothetical protein A2X49_15345 [Lentisphaerae bacterium GWF2_52_8]|nr:MAG: hypothetical protein A2X49_15345 [Lentisphaerae bacterium GWF2_52_8]